MGEGHRMQTINKVICQLNLKLSKCKEDISKIE